MSRFAKLVPLLLLAALAVAAIVTLVPVSEPESGMRLSISSEQARSRAQNLISERDIEISSSTPRITIVPQRSFIRQLQDKLSMDRANEVLRNSGAGYLWQVRFSRRGMENVKVTGGTEEQQMEAVRAWLSGDVTVRMDGDGGVLSLARTISDTVEMSSVSADSARVLAARGLEVLTGLELLTGVSPNTIVNDSVWSPRRIEHRSRIDHEFQWTLHNEASGNPVRVTVHVAGNMVSRADAEIVVPEAFKPGSDVPWQALVVILLWLTVIVTMVIISFRRFRAYEIGFRMAAYIGVAAAIIVAFELLISMSSREGWDFLFPLILGPLFYGGGLVLTWAVSESVVRETWREKMVSLDLVVNGHFFHSRIGASIVTGLCLGVVAYALDLSLMAGVGRLLPVAYFGAEETTHQGLTTFSPTLYSLTHALYVSAYLVAFFALFLVSWLRRRIRLTWVVVLVAALAISLSRASQYDPWWFAPVAVIGSSLAIVLAMVRYDAVAAFAAVVTMFVARQAALMDLSPSYEVSAMSLATIFGVVIVSGLVSQFRRNELQDFDAITPAFERHITERERLKHELEIARSVQMSFLPKTSPNIPRLDIASICEPAQEIGGDYYDFIPLADGTWGIAVGDVSGKGTQAAFFMTLTKGFLRALAQVSKSPAAVLTAVNRHFYENVERGIFISLVYGVFDPTNSTMTLARAGHNPAMRFRNGMTKAEVVNSTGLALGMDPGPAFEKSIQESVVSYNFGDVFVFYTDGISEAMNSARGEFGEERLAATIAKHGHGSAQQIMSGIFADVAEFVGKEKAHDDRTVVVVKIS